jgi:hypothetical protein
MDADGSKCGDERDQVSGGEQQVGAGADREPQRVGDGVEKPGPEAAQVRPYDFGQLA